MQGGSPRNQFHKHRVHIGILSGIASLASWGAVGDLGFLFWICDS